MRDIDDIDNLFKHMEEIMNKSFYGGYARAGNRRDIDISEDDKHLYVTIELRGVEKDNLVVTPSEDAITLEIMNGNSWINKTYSLPSKINPKKSKISFNNCILDIELLKVKEVKNGKDNDGPVDRKPKEKRIQKSKS
jgi:HSP20 family molecular chaperone IbpA